MSTDDNGLYFLPLGGSGEIGMNLNLYGYGPEEGRKWIMVDLGVTFGDLTTPGVDIIMPDPAYIEEFGGAAMEAMAVGVPAILAPELEPIYGPAALYADPEAIWPLVERLWRDRAFWEGRVAAGRDFVQENCGYDVFPGRLARLAAA